jgi:hypothetical protein
MTEPSDCVVVMMIVDTPAAEDGSEDLGVEETALDSDAGEETMDEAEVALDSGCEETGGLDVALETAVDELCPGLTAVLLPGLLCGWVFGTVFGALV